MAKDREKLTAHTLFVVQFKAANEIAAICHVQPKTVGEWIKKGNWKQERNARLNSSQNRAENVKEVIDNLSEQSIALFKELDKAKAANDKIEIFRLNKEAVAISQQVAMYNKTLQSIDKNNRISLEIYIEVMELIFKDLQHYDNAVYMRTLDFQSQHLNTAAVKFG